MLLLLAGLRLRRQTLSRRRLQAIYGNNVKKKRPVSSGPDKRAVESNCLNARGSPRWEGGGRTSEVPVEVVQPFDLGLHLVPHGLLQGLPLGRAGHQRIVRLRDLVDLQLQLEEEEEEEMFTL